MEKRTSIVCTFKNHPPIRFWARPEEGISCQYLDHYISTIWNARQDFGHHTIDYYTCKSGKRIYYASYNSGESYNSREPRTIRIYLQDADAIKQYFADMDRLDEWYRVCGDIDPTLIVDSDLL